jgi:SAM-dependent methyltransferase
MGALKPTHPGPFRVSDYQFIHCRDCDVVYLDPLPTAEDLRVLYEQSVQFADPIYTDPLRTEQVLEYYGTCLDNHRLVPPPGGRYLEVGAGLAWVSRAIKLRDSSVLTVAQDVSAECVAICPWVDEYMVGEVASVLNKGPFDLISLTHVIEHLSDPRTTLALLASSLDANGRMLITAPYRPSGWKPGDDVGPWMSYSYHHVPAHLYYLSETWFRQVEQHTGLQLVYWNAEHEAGQAFEAVLAKRAECQVNKVKLEPAHAGAQQVPAQSVLGRVWSRLRGLFRPR